MNQACMVPHWTSFVTALLVPIIALFGAFIAYRQWRTAREKLKLDLFEKRFSVYNAARNLVGSIVTSGQIIDEQMYSYLNQTIETKWLFGDAVAKYLKERLYEPALELQGLQLDSANMALSDQLTNNRNRQSEIKRAFLDELNEGLENLFAPYLQLNI